MQTIRTELVVAPCMYCPTASSIFISPGDSCHFESKVEVDFKLIVAHSCEAASTLLPGFIQKGFFWCSRWNVVSATVFLQWERRISSCERLSLNYFLSFLGRVLLRICPVWLLSGQSCCCINPISWWTYLSHLWHPSDFTFLVYPPRKTMYISHRMGRLTRILFLWGTFFQGGLNACFGPIFSSMPETHMCVPFTAVVTLWIVHGSQDALWTLDKDVRWPLPNLCDPH